MTAWQGRTVLVTGGASFIGSHLVDALVMRGARVRVVEDLSSGRRDNLQAHLDARRIEFLEGDLRDPVMTRRAIDGQQVVFHLAAAHGGRGYVDLHQAACAGNFLLDSLVFETCRQAGVEKIVYASSGCVAPDTLVETRVGLEPIGTLFDRLSGGEHEVVATERGPKPFTRILALGLTPQLHLETRRGFQLIGGKEHRILALSEDGQLRWTPLNHVKAGTVVLLKSNTTAGDNVIPLWMPSSVKKPRGQPRTLITLPGAMTPAFAEVLGYFIGDGSLNEPCGHVVFVDKDRETLSHIQRQLDYVFTVSGHIKERSTRSGRGTHALVVCCTTLMEYFRFLVGETSARQRKVPAIIFRADELSRAAFLRGLFGAEGWVDRSSGTIGMATASTTLAQQVQTLLLSLGVLSHHHVVRRRQAGYSTGEPTHEVTLVYAESYRRFLQVVGFLSTAKRRKAEAALRQRGTGSLEIPFIGRDVVKHQPWRGPRGTSTAYARWYSRNRARGIPRRRMREYLSERVVAETERAKWEFLCDESVYLDTIVSVQETYGEAYDFTVPQTSSYVSNGFISHNCVYPNFKQTDPKEILYLTEAMVGPPYDADNMYGWVKLMSEMTLQAFHKDYGMKSASCRYFTVYGPRGHENHAVIAMIARAFLKQDPFEVWGDGTQIRNWTWVGDIVEGTILAAERIDDGTAVNLGTMERIRVIDAVQMVLQRTGHRPTIRFRPEMPTGPLNRVADNALAKQLLGWEPTVLFRDGLARTMDWYFASKDPARLREFERLLTERGLHS